MSLTGRAAAERTLTGTIDSGGKVAGQITGLKVYHTDAYMLAVKNGFEGTLDEWLASLRPTDEEIKQAIADYMAKNPAAAIGEVTILADAWHGGGHLYSQEVEIAGVTENSQVDLTPSLEQLAIFYEKDLTFVTENDGGVVTVYAIGQKPTNDYTIQVTITEVSV
jgi:hypothetical protein